MDYRPRPELCGGCAAMRIPTATCQAFIRPQLTRAPCSEWFAGSSLSCVHSAVEVLRSFAQAMHRPWQRVGRRSALLRLPQHVEPQEQKTPRSVPVRCGGPLQEAEPHGWSSPETNSNIASPCLVSTCANAEPRDAGAGRLGVPGNPCEANSARDLDKAYSQRGYGQFARNQRTRAFLGSAISETEEYQCDSQPFSGKPAKTMRFSG